MGKIVSLECHMKSRAKFEAEDLSTYEATPAIRLHPLTVQQRGILKGQIPDDALWAWAVVQSRKGMQDACFVAGTADSQTSAVAQAQEAWKKLEEKWARERADGTARKILGQRQ
jgi:hypothetical protein